MKSDFDESQGVNENAYAQQVEREINFFRQREPPPSRGRRGPNPNSKSPTPDRCSVFQRCLIQENEPITLDAYHVHALLVKAIKGLLLLTILILLVRARSVVGRAVTALRARLLSVVRWVVVNETTNCCF
jgi:hypothetical protein